MALKIGSTWNWYIQSTISLYVLISLVPLGSSLKNTHMSCVKVRECTCEFPNGVGIDLSQLNVTTYVTTDNRTFYFQPCTAQQPVANCSNGTSICLHNGTASNLSLALNTEASFISFGVNQPISLLYQHNNGAVETKIDLTCERTGTDSSLHPGPDGIGDGQPYHFILKSPEACLWPVKRVTDPNEPVNKGLSTGSLIFTLLLILLLAYLIFGSLANYLLRGARGWEMVPNHDFWLRVPRLCMDGIRFALNGCRPPPSYEQI